MFGSAVLNKATVKTLFPFDQPQALVVLHGAMRSAIQNTREHSSRCLALGVCDTCVVGDIYRFPILDARFILVAGAGLGTDDFSSVT